MDDVFVNFDKEKFKKDLKALSLILHKITIDHGFYEGRDYGNKTISEMLCLIHSEISEALEALRKGNINKEENWENSFETELADAMIRIMDLAAFLNLDLGAAMFRKIDFNKNRPYKHGKNF